MYNYLLNIAVLFLMILGMEQLAAIKAMFADKFLVGTVDAENYIIGGKIRKSDFVNRTRTKRTS